MAEYTPNPAPIVPDSVYTGQGDAWQATSLSSGPWDPRAQHGGAPAALCVHLAEQAMADDGWQLSRLSLELIKPVPVASISSQLIVHAGRSTCRVSIDLFSGDTLVARAHSLLVRHHDLVLPSDIVGWSPAQMTPLPAQCDTPLSIPGMPVRTSFFHTAMEHRLAQGHSSQAGPAAAWFRLAHPMIQGQSTSPAMRAAAAADFGSGVSWILSPQQYLFSNADLSIHLHRPAVGEWIGVMAQSQIHSGGVGTTMTRLFDEHGPIGLASQTLVVRERPPMATEHVEKTERASAGIGTGAGATLSATKSETNI